MRVERPPDGPQQVLIEEVGHHPNEQESAPERSSQIEDEGDDEKRHSEEYPDGIPGDPLTDHRFEIVLVKAFFMVVPDVSSGPCSIYNMFDPSDFSALKPNLYTVRMARRVGQDIFHDPFGELACSLVFFQDNGDFFTWLYIGPDVSFHSCSPHGRRPSEISYPYHILEARVRLFRMDEAGFFRDGTHLADPEVILRIVGDSAEAAEGIGRLGRVDGAPRTEQAEKIEIKMEDFRFQPVNVLPRCVGPGTGNFLLTDPPKGNTRYPG